MDTWTRFTYYLTLVLFILSQQAICLTLFSEFLVSQSYVILEKLDLNSYLQNPSLDY